MQSDFFINAIKETSFKQKQLLYKICNLAFCIGSREKGIKSVNDVERFGNVFIDPRY